MSNYQPHEIEKKWQDAWERDGVYHAKDLLASEKENKFFGLVEFPYPSGDGLHVGHPRSYTAIDIVTRKKRMDGKNVMYPIGWDAFGLPTENYAIKNKVKPADATAKNAANFKRQIQSLGIGFDWSREINTTDPKYYKWTQWMFLKFFSSYFDEIEGRALPIEDLAIPESVSAQGEMAVREYIDAHRMAYKAESTINWCPKDKIGLANEEAQGGICERCGTPVEQRIKSQWMIRITKYADRLIDDLKNVDYLEKIRAQQINWIGRNQGAGVDFQIERTSPNPSFVRRGIEEKITVFTTRPDTLFGASFIVISPEMAKKWMDAGWQATEEVRAYVTQAMAKEELERTAGSGKEKTGVDSGIFAINPANQEKIPVWIADYVLGNYGTGAIMAVPAHDERDFEFATKFGLKIVKVVQPSALQIVPQPVNNVAAGAQTEVRVQADCWTEEGVAINSDFLNGLPTWKAKDDMISWLEEKGIGQRKTTYRLRDWVFSRQRYWGEPIPIVHCKTCGFVPVPEEQLPVTLPDIGTYEPTDTGESPLALVRSWVEVPCPKCGEKAERETDTMPNWAGSSWYFLRYCDPHNDSAFADPEKMKFWLPVDLYNGGMEHTTLHLLYSRFWYKFLYDLDLIPHECGNEPYLKRRSHALIMGAGGIKMSKSKGNVVNPDECVSEYGADVFRMYEMFIGPYDQDAPWDTQGIEGIKRFLEKVWSLFEPGSVQEGATLPAEVETLYSQTIKKVGEDIEQLHFNTAISATMILVNALKTILNEGGKISPAVAGDVLKLIAPYAPHMTEELWYGMGNTTSIHHASWPTFDATKLTNATFELVIQVNGKVRDRVTVDAEITEEQVKEIALKSEKAQAFIEGKTPVKVIYVKGKLVSVSV